MRLFDWVSSGSAILGQGVEDSRRAVSWMRHTLRGNRIAPPGSCEQGPGQPPVLLIHGYLGTRGSLHLLESRLTEMGHLVLTYRLGLLHTGDICESAALIARKIESIAAQTALDRMDIVGHSMGGLVGLYYLKRLGDGAGFAVWSCLELPLRAHGRRFWAWPWHHSGVLAGSFCRIRPFCATSNRDRYPRVSRSFQWPESAIVLHRPAARTSTEFATFRFLPITLACWSMPKSPSLWAKS